jgi:tripartite-type tricarboxylate transporter receptor subunit TctC
MNLSLVGFLGTLVLTLALAGASALAAEYPTKPITLVIQFVAGGTTDITGRVLANGTRKVLGQPMICENRPGGGGTVGVTWVANKPADGYTIGLVASSITVAYHMGKLNFHPIHDLTPLVRWGNYLFGIVVRADAPWKTLQDLIQYAKKNPGKLTYGSPGVGTPVHLAMEELSAAAGVEFIHMPYKGNAEDNAALLGGHIDIISNSSGWAPLVDAGKFHLLAILSEQRTGRYPQVPTVREAGYDVVIRSHLGVVGPKGLPTPIVAKLHEAFKKSMEEPEFGEALKKFDMVKYYLGPEEYGEYLREDFDRIGKLVKKLGLDKK